MPALIEVKLDPRPRVVWAGLVADRAAALESAPVARLDLGYGGPAREDHGGLTRPSCSRVMGLYPRNTEIRNTRQLAVMSEEELQAIASAMGLAALDPSLAGATLVVAGIPDFSHLPPGSRLQAEGGATLVVDMLNRPCTLPARPVETRHPGFGARFKPAARGRRGLTAWVERPGPVEVGAALRLFIPDQRPWAPVAGYLTGEDG